MNRKILYAALACLAAAGCALLAYDCSSIVGSRQGEMFSQRIASEDKIVLSFFGNKQDAGSQGGIERSMHAFMQAHEGVNLTYESLKGNDYFTMLEKRLAAGDGDDVFVLNHDLFLALKNKGRLAELQDLKSIRNIDRNLLDADRHGRIYWVPTTVSAFGLYCNEDLLRKHNQKIPSNLAEWRKVNDYFVEKGITPVIANNDISLKTMAIGLSFRSGYKDGSIAGLFDELNSGSKKLGDALLPGFRLVEEFIRKHYVDSDKALVTEKTSDDLKEFARGESPFMLTGAWAANRVRNMKPGFAFSVHPLPILEDGGMLVVNADTRLAVNAGSENVQLAREYVDNFCSLENLDAFCQEQASFSPSPEGASARIPEILPLQETYKAKRFAVGSDNRLHLPIWKVSQKAAVSILKGADAERAMQELDEAVAAFLNK